MNSSRAGYRFSLKRWRRRFPVPALVAFSIGLIVTTRIAPSSLLIGQRGVFLASLALCASFAALSLNSLLVRGRLGMMIVKCLSFIGMTVSLGVLLASCGYRQFTVTGTVLGLPAGDTLKVTMLNDSEGTTTNETVTGTSGSTAVPFSFPNVNGGDLISVKFTAPTGVNCSFTGGVTSGPLNQNDVITIQCASMTTTTYSIGGTVTGLQSGTTLTITDTVSGTDTTVTGPGSFTLESLPANTNYSISLSPPSGQICTINPSSAASGTITAAVNLSISCFATSAPTYSITGAINGLSSGGIITITDQVSGASVQVVGPSTPSTMPFTLESDLPSGTAYNVTLTPPNGETCIVTSGTASNTTTGITSNVVLGITCTENVTATGLNNPNGLVLDSQNNLYVANNGANQVLVYTEQLNSSNAVTGLVQTHTITAGISGPTRLTFDSAGNLYVTNAGSNEVTVYDTNLNQIISGTISTGISQPLGIAFDQLGNLYVANNNANTITVYTGTPATGFTLQATLTQDGNGTQFSAPGVITFAPMGGYNGLFVGLGPSGDTNSVLLYSAPLTSSSMPNGVQNNNSCTTGPTGPTGIATSGNQSSETVYESNLYNSSVNGYLLASFLGNECTTPNETSTSNSGISGPEGLVIDSSGNIFVSNSASNTITVYTSISSAPIYTHH